MLRFAFLITLLFPLQCICQAPNFIIKNYTVEDGLPSNETYRIVQDHEGYIWIATDRGLTRWDGYEFKVYGAEQGLNDISVIDVKLSPKGKVWVCTYGGDLYYLDRNKDRLAPYQFNEILKKYVGKNNYPRRFSIHENDRIIFSFDSKSAIKIDSLGKVMKLDDNISNIIGCNIHTMDDQMYYSCFGHEFYPEDETYSKGQYTFNGNEFPFHPNVEFLGGGSYELFPYGENKSVIIINQTNYLFEKGEYLFYQHDNGRIQDIKYDLSTGIYVSKVGNRGLLHFENEKSFEKNISTVIIEGESIGGLLIDRTGDLWACSLENGIYSLKRNTVTQITKKYNRAISSFQNGLAIIEGAKKLKVLDKEHLVIYESEFVEKLQGLSTIQDGQGLIIQGGRSFYFDPNYSLREMFSINNRKNPLTIYKGTIVENSFISLLKRGYCFYENRTTNFGNGKFIDGQIQYYDVAYFQKEYYFAAYDGLFKKEDLYEDSEGELWTELNMRINALGLFRDVLILGSNSKGLLVWNGDRIVGRLNASDRLLSNSIEILERYNEDYILVGTKKGISIVGIENDSLYVVKNITTSYGLPSNNIMDLEVVGDQIYYATSSGSGVFTFDVSLADSTVVLFDGWQVNETERKDFQYASDENNISINYKTIDFRQEGNIHYRYRLNEETWTNTKATLVNYASLKPGKYLFEVQSQNVDGNWGYVKSQEFSIAFPWYETWWFRVLAAFGIVGLGYYVYQIRVSAIRKEGSINEEIKQLELQALRAQMNPHFIFNCLTSIQNFIQKKESESAMTYLSKFAKLVRQTLNASSEEIHSLQDELNMLENYLALERLRFKDLFTYDFQIEEGLDPLSITIPPMLIQPLVENCIKHGFQGIDYQGRIIVSISRGDDDIVIAIEDNGKGIKSNASNSNRKSFGTSIAARRLELISLTDAELEVTTPPSGQGTLVMMRIPQ